MEKKQYDIVLVHATAGGGHKSIATAIYKALAHEQGLKIAMVDSLDYGNSFSKHMGHMYAFLYSRLPAVWNALVKVGNTDLFARIANQVQYATHRGCIKRFLNDYPAQMYVATYNFLPYPLGRMRENGYAYQIVSFVPDLSFPVIYAFDAYADLVIVPTEEVLANYMKSYKSKPKNCVQMGLPVAEEYYSPQKPLPKHENLNILVTTGGEGGGKIYDLCQKLDSHLHNAQIAVSVGRNKSLLNTINTTKWKNHISAFGLVPSLYEYYQKATLVIGKAGPNSLWECMVLDKPLILYGYVRGQEDGNTDFAQKHMRARYIPDFDKLARFVAQIDPLNVDASFVYPPKYDSARAQTNWSERIAQLLISRL